MGLAWIAVDSFREMMTGMWSEDNSLNTRQSHLKERSGRAKATSGEVDLESVVNGILVGSSPFNRPYLPADPGESSLSRQCSAS